MWRNALPMIVSVLLLAGAAAERLSLPVREDEKTAAYHEHVRKVAETAPTRIGDWISRDVPVPTEAVDLLKPNVLISREYTHLISGERVSLLLVQGSDLRELIAHYPPVCYPGRGLRMAEANVHRWDAAGMPVEGTEYEFESNTFQRATRLVVCNFMVMPDGRILRDWDGAEQEVGMNYRYYGAAQMQLVFSGGTARSRRDAIIGEILGAYRPLIDAVGAGVSR
jgi:hypothetical protein